MGAYTAGHIRITGSLAVDKVLEFELTGQFNRHGTLYYQGYIDGAAGKKLVEQSLSGGRVTAFVDDTVVFCGLPQKVELLEENGLYRLGVHCISHSFLLDTTENSRSFQKTKMTYTDMLAKVYKKAKGGASIMTAQGKDRIQKPILQYRETDWQFTLRMAGKLGVAVLPNLCADHPQVAFGVPSRKTQDYNPKEYSVKRCPHSFLQKTPLYKDNNYGDFLEYRTYDDDNALFQLGDTVRVKGSVLAVVRTHLRLDKGTLRKEYTFGSERAHCAPYITNDATAGLALKGEVLASEALHVKLHLDIDSEQSEGDAYWFAFAPQTNNGMYCMPQVGSRAVLQWSSHTDADALVVHCWRDNGGELPDYQHRYFTTEHGKQLAMLPSLLSFTSDSNKISMAAGMQVKTGRQLQITSGQSMTITGRRVYLESPQQIIVQQVEDNSSIIMEAREIHIKGKQVTTQGGIAAQELPPVQRKPLKTVTLSQDVVDAVTGAVPARGKV